MEGRIILGKIFIKAHGFKIIIFTIILFVAFTEYSEDIYDKGKKKWKYIIVKNIISDLFCLKKEEN